MLDEWRTDWYLAGTLAALVDGGRLEVRVGGLSVSVVDEEGRIVARAGERELAVMMVDDEIFVLLGDERR